MSNDFQNINERQSKKRKFNADINENNDCSENENEDPNTLDEFEDKTRKKITKWNEQELVYLVYFVGRHGRSWSQLSTVYRNYFQNRDRKDLLMKYCQLEKSTSFLEDLKKKAELLKDEDFVRETEKVKKKKFIKWTQHEILYLVHGVEKYGRKWTNILATYQNHFQKERKSNDLQARYQQFEKNVDMFEFFKKQSKNIF